MKKATLGIVGADYRVRSKDGGAPATFIVHEY